MCIYQKKNRFNSCANDMQIWIKFSCIFHMVILDNIISKGSKVSIFLNHISWALELQIWAHSRVIAFLDHWCLRRLKLWWQIVNCEIKDLVTQKIKEAKVFYAFCFRVKHSDTQLNWKSYCCLYEISTTLLQLVCSFSKLWQNNLVNASPAGCLCNKANPS
jgi:hypothetical protein